MDGLPEHQQRDTVNVPSSEAPFRKIIDSTVMISVARFVMPFLITVALGGLGWVINDLKAGQRDGLAEVKDGQSKVWLQIGKMVDAQVTANAIQSGLSVQVNNTAKQLDHLQVQVDGLPRK